MRFWMLGGLVLALVAAPTTWAQTAVVPPKNFDLEAIDAYIASYVKEKGLVGLSVAVMRDGKIVLAMGYGQRSLADSLPVTADTSFAVGSVTKQFVCSCVLLLAEEGKLSVNDPVAKFFPSLTRAGDITLLDLMNHTAGYPDYYPLDFLDRRMTQPITLEAMLKQYASGPLDFEPKSRYSYSNTGYIILGGVEKVTGAVPGDLRSESNTTDGDSHPAARQPPPMPRPVITLSLWVGAPPGRAGRRPAACGSASICCVGIGNGLGPRS
jgi:CubicO group peptidase (beta-lactamase class C family)